MQRGNITASNKAFYPIQLILFNSDNLLFISIFHSYVYYEILLEVPISKKIRLRLLNKNGSLTFRFVSKRVRARVLRLNQNRAPMDGEGK